MEPRTSPVTLRAAVRCLPSVTLRNSFFFFFKSLQLFVKPFQEHKSQLYFASKLSRPFWERAIYKRWNCLDWKQMFVIALGSRPRHLQSQAHALLWASTDVYSDISCVELINKGSTVWNDKTWQFQHMNSGIQCRTKKVFLNAIVECTSKLPQYEMANSKLRRRSSVVK